MITIVFIMDGNKKLTARLNKESQMAGQSRTTITLTENNIHTWVGEAQFNRGLQYVNEGLVIPRSCHRNLVRGWCLPRDGQPGSYYVWARLRNLRVVEAHCTCNLGKYGICPHLAAVLVGYVRNPQCYQRTLWQRIVGFFSGLKALQPLQPVEVANNHAHQVA